MPNLKQKVAKGAVWTLSWKKAHEYIRAHNWLLLEWIKTEGYRNECKLKVDE